MAEKTPDDPNLCCDQCGKPQWYDGSGLCSWRACDVTGSCDGRQQFARDAETLVAVRAEVERLWAKLDHWKVKAEAYGTIARDANVTLGAGDMERLRDTAKRVVAERDSLRTELAEAKRQLDAAEAREADFRRKLIQAHKWVCDKGNCLLDGGPECEMAFKT